MHGGRGATGAMSKAWAMGWSSATAGRGGVVTRLACAQHVRGVATTPAPRAAAGRVTVPPFALKEAKGFIDGAWRDASDGKTLTVRNPATGAIIATVPDMGRRETLDAVAAARRAFPAWAAKTAAERTAIVRRLHDLVVANTDTLAVTLTQECGKPWAESKGEIAYSASFLEWFAEEGKRMYGDVIPAPRVDRRIVTLRQPVGVAAMLTPWNFSSAMVARKLAPALVAGCTVVVRPSSNTPLSAMALVQLAHEAGVPPGVVNLVVGDDHDAIAGTLCRHPDVAKLSFTGSTQVGRLLVKQTADSLKRLSMELGGNAPFIVFPDANLDDAVEGCIASKFRNAGQTCVCANRIYVHADVYDTFKTKLAAKVAALTVGDGMVNGTAVGPLISAAALAKTEGLVSDAVAAGAAVVVGGRRVTPGTPGTEQGYFYAPTVLENVAPSMSVVRQEIFGPVAPLVKFQDERDVIAQANESDVGLAAYFYTANLSTAWRVAEALQVGMVGVNTGIISTAAAPFGGVKQSGFGREGSRYGLDEYTNIKYIMMGV